MLKVTLPSPKGSESLPLDGSARPKGAAKSEAGMVERQGMSR